MDVSRSDSRSSMNDEDRYDTYVAQRKRQQAEELDAMEEDQHKQVQTLAEAYKKQFNETDQAFRVELKHNTESNQAQLDQLSKEHQVAVKNEKENDDKEFESIRKRERTRVENYKKNQDAAIQKLHEKYLAAQEEMDHSNNGT